MYKLSPSKAHRYLNCSASLKHDVPFVETSATIRGNLLHSLAEMLLKNADIFDINAFIKEHDINEYEYKLVTRYYDTVMFEKDLIQNSKLRVEVKQPLHIFGFDINFVVDALVIGRKEMSIIDLKTGNRDIDAEDNEQLYFYGYGIMLEHPTVEKIDLSIFQKMKQKKITLTRGDILDFFLEKEQVFIDIRNNDLKYNPSDKACSFCAIKDTCEARAKWIVGGKK